MSGVIQTASSASRVQRRAVCQSEPAHGLALTGVVDNREPRTWLLRWSPAHRAQVEAILRDVAANACTAIPFTPPGEVDPVQVLYLPDVSIAPLSSGAAEVSVSVEELLTTD